LCGEREERGCEQAQQQERGKERGGRVDPILLAEREIVKSKTADLYQEEKIRTSLLPLA